jgi:phosphohistidine phosphatase
MQPRELHKKDGQILWHGHLARPCVINRLFGLHHNKFWDIFLFESHLIYMEIYLIRHVIAQEHKPGLKHEKRQLTPEGREKTEKIAQRLVKLGFNFDLILTSPLVRAYQTAEILIAAGLSSQLEASDHLSFDGNIQNWWQEWLKPRKYPQKTKLALVGHEPSLSHWAEILLWGEAKESIILKKAGMMGIKLPDDGSPLGRSQMFWLTQPKYLL